MIADQLKNAITKIIDKNEDPFPEIEGQWDTKMAILSTLLAGRNLIIEGYPGVGKTTIAKAVARFLPKIKAVEGCPFHCDPDDPVCPSCKEKLKSGTIEVEEVSGSERFIRIQGSPDLQVEDLLGDIDPALAFKYGPTDFRAFKPGKLLRANGGVLFFDELNRCPERLQNALLQVLEEHRATISGYLIDYPADFVLIATMNPGEFAGTERLSDVLIDRFDIVSMSYPENAATEREILLKKGKRILDVPSNALNLIIGIVRATRNDERIQTPAGVRATIGLYERSQAVALIKKKKYVDENDIREVAVSVLAHRIKLAPKVRHTQNPEKVIQHIVEEVMSGTGPPSSEGSQIITNMINRGIPVLDPDYIARLLVNNLESAKKFLGKETIHELTGLNDTELKRREKQFEAINEVKAKINKKIGELKSRGILDSEGNITEVGYELAIEETLKMEGFGEGEHAQQEMGREVIVGLKPFSGSYRNLAFRPTLRRTLMRGRRFPEREDWRAWEKKKAERVDYVFLIDSSGSMAGDKIESCKKAALSLSHWCRRRGDRMAVISFREDAAIVSPLETDPRELAISVIKIMPSGSTDIAKAINKSYDVLTDSRGPKHVILITDAIPTKGEDPIQRAVEETDRLAEGGATLSVVGIDLDGKGEEIARMLAGVGRGKFYHVSLPSQVKEKVMIDVYNF